MRPTSRRLVTPETHSLQPSEPSTGDLSGRRAPLWHRRRFRGLAAAALLSTLALLSFAAVLNAESTEADLAAARAVFEANLAAIADQDRDAYLACYLESDRLVRTGSSGFTLGFDDLAAGAGDGWPEVFEAQDLRLTPLEPGLVYGTYRYRVRFDGVEQTGLSERLFVETPDGWRIALTTAFPAAPGTTPPPPRALVGATLVDGTGALPVPDSVVLLRDGQIECAGTRADCPLTGEVGVVDLTGSWITPGLIDAHVHYSQTGWADGRPDFIDVRDRHPYAEVIAERRRSPDTYHRAFLCSGVTGVFDVGGYPWTWDMAATTETDTLAPHVAAAGPLLTTLDHWINQPAERQFIYIGDEEEAREGVAYLDAGGADAAKVWFINHDGRAFEEMKSVVAAAGEEAGRRELELIVHATGLEEARVAVEAGAGLLVHSVWDREVDDDFIQLMLERGTIYCPTLTVPAGYQRLAEAVVAGKAPVVDDPNGCVDAETRARVASSADLGAGDLTAERLERRARSTAERGKLGAANLVRLAEAGVPIAMGTDAGNPLTLHGPSVYAELEAMQAAGLSPMAVLVSATSTAARAMGREDDLGTVEAGKIADLVVLSADPTADIAAFRRLTHVVRGGVLRPIAELAAATE
jgi:imidazolonepropionase-like amidohydrolase